ncbi:MAG: sigma-70 family RNA polymerase sigma factor, partial [Bacteroidales bacterium]|nr:sigma-70 family RNA polymerase sigma factor [Bacteroidales bacterium]
GRIEAIEREFTQIQTDESGELQLHREEVYRQLLSAIEQLPAKQRELFLLSVQGKTSAEIAAEMGITPESVKKQRQRGLARLRELLPPEAFLLLLFLLE